MATANVTKALSADLESVRKEWLDRLSSLVESVETWAKHLGWATRRIEKKMDDSQLGHYVAPALLLQADTFRVLLEPIARSAPGADGVVDLYLMPAYDDIASLYFSDGQWQLHYMLPTTSDVASIREAPAKVLSPETLQEVLDQMTKNAT